MAVTPQQQPGAQPGTSVAASADEPAPYDETETGLVLVCSRCNQCGTRAFPYSEHCSRCGAEGAAVEQLPRIGTLWTWTSQSVRPKTPPYAGAEAAEDFIPFLVGYVQFDGGLCVEGRLADCDGAPALGQEMEVAERVVAHDGAGTPVVTYVFRPVDEEQ